MKTREQLLRECFLNRAEIQRLYGFSQKKANKVFDMANAFDDDDLKEYRIDDRKVRLTTVLKITGVSYKTLERNVLG